MTDNNDFTNQYIIQNTKSVDYRKNLLPNKIYTDHFPNLFLNSNPTKLFNKISHSFSMLESWKKYADNNLITKERKINKMIFFFNCIYLKIKIENKYISINH